MRDKLSEDAILTALEDLDGWAFEDGKLHREFKFTGFVEAFGFMTQAAIEAEKMDHHPEWSNVYSKVVVDLTTHSAGGVTVLDFQLAGIMNKLAGQARRGQTPPN